jgi:hypothetical protein
LRRELFGQERFSAVHRQLRRNRFQFEPRGALGRFDFGFGG